MIERDYILRQIHQLAQALAQVLFARRAGRDAEATEAIERALLDTLGLDLARLRALDHPGLLTACGAGEADAMGAARILAVADLLAQDAEAHEDRRDHDAAAAGYARARWLYEAAAGVPGVALPFDFTARVARLWEREVQALDAVRAR